MPLLIPHGGNLLDYSNNILQKKKNDIDWKDIEKWNKNLYSQKENLLRQRDTRTIWTRRQGNTGETNQRQGGVTRRRWKSCQREEVSNRSARSIRRSKIKQEVKMGQQEILKMTMAWNFNLWQLRKSGSAQCKLIYKSNICQRSELQQFLCNFVSICYGGWRIMK